MNFSKLFKKQAPINFEEILVEKRIELFRKKKVHTILDVGANTGQYAEMVLKYYDCNVISFEPMKKEYDILQNKLMHYKSWKALNYGLGNKDCEIDIHVSKNSYSSSMLALKEETVTYDEVIGYIAAEKVQLKKLDSVWEKLHINGDTVLLKIDTQGYEYNVMDGARNVMNKISGLQIEMAAEQLYEGEVLMEDMLRLVKGFGFHLYIIEPGYADPKSGKLLQVEAIFFKD